VSSDHTSSQFVVISDNSRHQERKGSEEGEPVSGKDDTPTIDAGAIADDAFIPDYDCTPDDFEPDGFMSYGDLIPDYDSIPFDLFISDYSLSQRPKTNQKTKKKTNATDEWWLQAGVSEGFRRQVEAMFPALSNEPRLWEFSVLSCMARQ